MIKINIIYLLRHYWPLLLGLIVLWFVFLVVTAVLEAYFDTKKAPREEMFWCYKHGYFRKKHALPLFPHLGGTTDSSFICPVCYYDTVFKTPNERLN